MKMNKKLEAAQEFFNKNASEALVSVGAVPYEDGFHLNTRVGPLHIWVLDNWFACQFDDAEAAHVATKGAQNVSNRHNGKWNWYYNNDPVTLNCGMAIADFMFELQKLVTTAVGVPE
jgi:hypothetical protein